MGPHFASPLVQFLYDWQTLVGALLALLAAIVGSILLWRQIKVSENQEADRRRRRFAAARATLPHILSEIVSYLDTAMEWMCEAHKDVQQQPPAKLPDPPLFPASVIESLENLIEATTVDQAAKACASILSELQTFRARIGSVARASRRKDNIRVGLHFELENYMIQAADIHRRVELLYPFARAEQDEVPQQTAETYLFKSLSSLGCSEVAFGNVFQRANELDKKRQNRALPPAEAEPSSEPENSSRA